MEGEAGWGRGRKRGLRGEVSSISQDSDGRRIQPPRRTRHDAGLHDIHRLGEQGSHGASKRGRGKVGNEVVCENAVCVSQQRLG